MRHCHPVRFTLLTIAVLAAAALVPVPLYAADTLKVTAREATVHASPNLQSTTLARVPQGTLLEMIGKENDWYKVVVPSAFRLSAGGPTTGWVMARVVSVVQAPAGSAAPGTARPGTTITRPGDRGLQPGRPGVRPAARRIPNRYRIYGEAAYEWFTAKNSFDAVFGSPTGLFYGGGAEVIYRGKFFAQLGVTHFQASGERVMVFNGEVFPLGLDVDVSITPITLNVGYRFQQKRFTPYLGGGVGLYMYSEKSYDSEANVSKSPLSYQVLGGLEFPVSRSIALAGEVQYQAAPGILGKGGASEQFGETDAGGFSVRLKVLFGK